MACEFGIRLLLRSNLSHVVLLDLEAMQLKNESGMIVLSLTQFLFAPYWHYLIELNRINTPPRPCRLPLACPTKFVGLNGKFFELYATLPATIPPKTGTAICARLVRSLMGDERILFLSNPLTWGS